VICDGDGGRGREKLNNIVTFIFIYYGSRGKRKTRQHKAIILQKVKKDQKK
jgi:hypothetical protein